MSEATSAGTESVTVPDHFICPISLEIMQEPVICTDGNTYEKRDIERWLATHDTSPKTNMVLFNKTLISNCAIKSGIQKFLAANAPKKKVCRTIRVNGRHCKSNTLMLNFHNRLRSRLVLQGRWRSLPNRLWSARCSFTCAF